MKCPIAICLMGLLGALAASGGNGTTIARVKGLIDLRGATQTLNGTSGKWLPAGEKIVVTNGTLKIETVRYSEFGGELIALKDGTIGFGASLNLQMTKGAPRILADGGTVDYTGKNSYVGVSLDDYHATGVVEVVNGGRFNARQSSDFVFGQGRGNVGKLLIASGGTADFGATPVTLGNSDGARGVLHVQGGTLRLGALSTPSAGALVDATFDRATLVAAAASDSFVGAKSAQGSYKILAGGLTLDNAGSNIGIAASFGGTGGLTLAGAGRTTFTAAQMFTGGLTVCEGTTLGLKQDANAFAGRVVFAAGARLNLEFTAKGLAPLKARSIDFSALTAEKPLVLTLDLSAPLEPGVSYRVFAMQEGTMTPEDKAKIVLPPGLVGTLENGSLFLHVDPKTTLWRGSAGNGIYDASVGDFPRQAGETGDSARIMRAVAVAGKGGVVWFPRGDYAIDQMLVVSNKTSLLLHKSANLKAVREMPYVMRYFGSEYAEIFYADHNLFIKGGQIDGNGLASGLNVLGLRHFTMGNMTIRNGKRVGLQFGDPSLPRFTADAHEVICNNIYLICDMPGLAGNIGFLTHIGDSEFTDIHVIDYTIGIRDCKWSNHYTRCHVWGGPIMKKGTNVSEMLENSIAFDLQGNDCLLDGCYADTAMIGYNVCNHVRIFNCAYFSNPTYKLDNMTVFNHLKGSLTVTGGRFAKTAPHVTLYKRGPGAKKLFWNDNVLLNFSEKECEDLNRELKKSIQSESASTNETKLAATDSRSSTSRKVVL